MAEKPDVAIYEMRDEVPTKIRIKRSIFVLKPNIQHSPDYILEVTKQWTELIDFGQTALLKAAAGLPRLKQPKRTLKSNNDKFTNYYTVGVYKSVITEIYRSFTDAVTSNTDTAKQRVTNKSIEAVIKKSYPSNSVTTLKNKRAAYISVLMNNGYLEAVDNKRFNNTYKFIKKPEWIVIPEIDEEEIKIRRQEELKTMRAQ